MKMKLLWGLYALVGIGAFAVSYYLESLAIKAFLGHVAMAVVLAAVFEGAKALTIILYRFLKMKKGHKAPSFVVKVSFFSRAGLILLSLVCSIAVLSGNSSPRLAQVKTKDTSLVEKIYTENTAHLKEERETRINQAVQSAKEKYRLRNHELDRFYLPRIADEEKGRDHEFITGKGRRYNEHVAKLNELTRQYQLKKDNLRASEAEEVQALLAAIEMEFQAKLDGARSKRAADLQRIQKDAYASDERVKDPMIAGFLKTMDLGLALQVGYFNFVAGLSLLLSLLLEAIIYVVFNYLVVAYYPIWNLQHDITIGQEKIKAEAEDELFRDNVGLKVFKKKLDRQADKIKTLIKKQSENIDPFDSPTGGNGGGPHVSPGMDS